MLHLFEDELVKDAFVAQVAPNLFSSLARMVCAFGVFVAFRCLCHRVGDVLLARLGKRHPGPSASAAQHTFPCCWKRRARYWRCARRRARCQRQGQANNSDDCPLAKLCRLRLPPPLPFLRRRKCVYESTQAASKGASDLMQEDIEEAKNLDAPTSEAVATQVEHISGSLSPPQVPFSAESFLKRPSTVHLLDLARMQQWKVILEQPRLKRREARYRDGDGLYPLHWAAAGGSPPAVLQALLETYPSAAHKADRAGSMPLHFAAHYSASYESVKVLLHAYPAAIRYQDRYGRTPLYHATDKSTSLEVLKLLVDADPATITLPCHLPSRSVQDPKMEVIIQAAQDITRTAATRTPLYLMWAAMLWDRHSRVHRRGKTWNKAKWMLSIHYQNFCGQAYNEDSTVLHAAIALDKFLPEQVLTMMIASYPDQLCTPDPSTGRVALTTAASSTYYSSDRAFAVIKELLEACPQAARYRSPHSGRSALMEAAAAGHSINVINLLLQAVPEAQEWRDGATGLPLALVAATAPPYQEVEHAGVAEGDLDPLHLLFRKKQHDGVIDQAQSERNAAETCEQGASAVGEDTAHLTTIYALLQRNPSQLQGKA
jgi:Ankyrin repeats (3 copies)